MKLFACLVFVAVFASAVLAGDAGKAASAEPKTVVTGGLPVPQFQLPTVSAADLIRFVLVTLFVQVVGFLWYGPFFSGLYVNLAFGSMANFKKIENAKEQGYFFDYRRSMLGSWIGAFLIVFALSYFNTLLNVTSIADAYVVALIGSVVGAGSSLLHDFWRGSSVGVVLFDQAFNAVVFPLASALLLTLKPFF